jgi:hypothetical protein
LVFLEIRGRLGLQAQRESVVVLDHPALKDQLESKGSVEFKDRQDPLGLLEKQAVLANRAHLDHMVRLEQQE